MRKKSEKLNKCVFELCLVSMFYSFRLFGVECLSVALHVLLCAFAYVCVVIHHMNNMEV